MKKVNVQDAVGMELCHDITAMFDGFKGPLFKRGHIIAEEDIPRLLDIGKKTVFVWEEMPARSTRRTLHCAWRRCVPARVRITKVLPRGKCF